MVLVSSAVGSLFKYLIVGEILEIDSYFAPHQPYKGVCPEGDDKQLTYQYVWPNGVAGNEFARATVSRVTVGRLLG